MGSNGDICKLSGSNTINFYATRYATILMIFPADAGREYFASKNLHH